MPIWRTSLSPFPTPADSGIHMSPPHPMHCADLLPASVPSPFQDSSGSLALLGWGQDEEKRAESPLTRCVVKVSGIHRRIRLIDADVDTNNSPESDLVSTRPDALHMDVFTLDLGHMTSFAHARRSLEDIHSEERSGFSRWQRPGAEPQSKTDLHVCVGSGIDEKRKNAETSLQVVAVADADQDTFAKMRANGMGNSESIHSMAGAFKHGSSSMSASIASPSQPCHVAAQHISSFSNRCLTPQAIRRESASTDLLRSKMLEMQQYVDHVPSHSSSEGCKEDGDVLATNEHESSTTHVVGDDHRVLEDVDHRPIQPAANIIISPIIIPNGTPIIEETSLIEFLRAKKQNRDHFLDKIVARAEVYDNHPWHFASAATAATTAKAVGGCLYFCCTTQYTTRGNVTRNRMTKDGGRWKQQGIVQPILTTREPARKTYLSYIARGRSDSSAYLVPSMAGRVKHRHRMVEIALEEDMESEKIHIKRKLTPLPFLVVCILRMST